MNNNISEHSVYDLESFYYITFNEFEDNLVQRFYYQKYNKNINKEVIYISASSWNTLVVKSDGNPTSNKLMGFFEFEDNTDKPIIISLSTTSSNFIYSLFDENDIPNNICRVNVNLYYGFKRWVYDNINIKPIKGGLRELDYNSNLISEDDVKIIKDISNQLKKELNSNRNIKFIHNNKNEEWFQLDVNMYNSLIKSYNSLNIKNSSVKTLNKIDEQFGYSSTVTAGIVNNKLVVGATKIASTWIRKKSKVDFDIKYDCDSDYNRFKNLTSFEIHYNPKNDNLYIEPSFIYDMDFSEEEIKYISSIVNHFNNPQLKTHILIRNPLDRYMQSVYQDLFSYINNFPERNSDIIQNNILNFLEKDETYESNTRKLISFFSDTSLVHTFETFLRTNILDVKLIESILKNSLKFLLDDNHLSDDLNWYSKCIRTHHYSTYYATVLKIVMDRGIDNIKILDLDDDNIHYEIFEKAAEDNRKANQAPDIIKNIFQSCLSSLIHENDNLSQEVDNYLYPDRMIYQILKKRYKQ